MPSKEAPQLTGVPSGLEVEAVPKSITRKSGAVPTTPFPFKASRRAYDLALQAIPTRDLLAEIEAARWLALDVAGDTAPGGSHAVALLQLEALLDECLRRERLMAARAYDPLRPAWPPRDDGLRSRIDAVKAAWPIEQFCAGLLGAQLQSVGKNRWKARCPLPGHEDRTPSFFVYGEDDHAWCFGCNRGGDVITLTGYALGLERFYDRLEHLERLSPKEWLGAS